MHVSYLSLGSNLGDRAANLRNCIHRLGELGAVRNVSSFYETEPTELREQPWFLNCAVELATNLKAPDLLLNIQNIEAELGRSREIVKGPRTIDIDILLYGDTIVSTPGLEIPHERMAQRRFVLDPLAELAPELRHPRTGATVSEMLARVQNQKVERI